MTHLILGSSGQIGSHLTEYIRKQGDEVIEFDIVRHVSEDLRLFDTHKLMSSINKSDFVHFLAFDVGGSTYLKRYQHTPEFMDNNMKIMTNVFKLLHTYKKPFIFASSQMANMSYSPYGVLKSVGEQYTKILGGLLLKFWNVYGIEHDPEKSHVITDFIKMAKKDQHIKMRTDGTEERQFLFAEDCSECLYLLSQKYNTIDRSKNLHITNFEWTTVNEIARVISELASNEFGHCKVTPSARKDDVQQNKKNEADPYILELWKPKTALFDGIKYVYERT